MATVGVKNKINTTAQRQRNVETALHAALAIGTAISTAVAAHVRPSVRLVTRGSDFLEAGKP